MLVFGIYISVTFVYFHQARLAGGSFTFCDCPSVRPSVRLLPDLWTWYFEYEWSANGARSKGMNGQLCGAAGQRSKPHETKDRFGGLTFALFSTRLGWVAFLDPLTFCLALPVLPPTTYYSSPHSALGGLAPSVFWLEPPLNVERSSLWA